MYKPDPQCIHCLKVGTVEVLENDTWDIPANPTTPAHQITGIICQHCTACHEKWTDPSMSKHNHARFVEGRRQAEKLLSGQEIYALLSQLPYSQKDIEYALNLGANSIARWKNNEVCQSSAADGLLFAIGEDPSLVEKIAKRRGITLSGRRKGRPPNSKKQA